MDAIFIGRYKVIEELGRGGMGVVYKGEDPVLERPVAIKVLPPKKLTQKAIERFLREAKTAARLDSPYIVKIYDIGQADDIHFIVMEYVEGGSVGDMIEDEVVPNAAQMKQRMGIFKQVLEAVAYAHEHGVIHRDLKPDNIMVTTSGQAKVMDFGLAFFEGHHSLTEVGQVMGTAAYVSPEQAMGKITDQRTDIYSLGVILFELVTGRWPFNASNPLEMFRKVAEEEPPSPAEFNPELPSALESIILRMLAKQPDNRYQHVKDILTVFDDALTTSPGYSSHAPQAPAARPSQLASSFSSDSGFMSVEEDVRKRLANLQSLVQSSPSTFMPPMAPYQPPASAYKPSSQPAPKAANLPDMPKPGPVLREAIEQTAVDAMPNASPLAMMGTPLAAMTLKKSDKPAAGSASAPFAMQSLRKEAEPKSDAEEKPQAKTPLEESRRFASSTGKAVASSSWMQTVKDEPTGSRIENMMDRLQKQNEAEAAEEAEASEKSQFCPACGAENAFENKMCSRCGGILKPSSYVVQREASTYFRAGMENYDDGRYSEAIMEFLQAIAKNPDNGEYYLYLGRSYLEICEYGQARTSLERAVALMKDSGKAYLALADFFLKTEQPELVISSLHKALDIEPEDTSSRCRLAFLYYEQGRTEAAVEQYRIVTEQDPNNIEAHRQLGLILVAAGHPQEAIPYLEQVCALDPSDPRAYSTLAKVYAKCGNQSQAQQAMRDAISADENNPELHATLADMYISQRQDQQAAQELTIALDLEPGNCEATVALSTLLYQHGQTVDAVQQLEKALAYHPHDLMLHRNLGEIYMYSGHLEKALDHFEEVVKNDPECAEMYNRIGRIYLKKRYDKESVNAYQKAVELHPVNPEYREDLAMAYYCAGQLPAAVHELSKAARLDYKNPDYSKALGIMLVDMRQYEEAVRQFKHSLEMRPQDPQSHGMLGKALVGQGLTNLAISEFQHALELDPSMFLLNLPLARAYAQQGRHDLAIACFKRFLGNVNSNTDKRMIGDAYVDMGMSYLNGKQYARAEEIFKAVLHRNPNESEALHGMAKVCLAKNKPDDAQKWIDKALSVSPRDSALKITKASIQGAKGQWNNAVMIMQEAMNEHPNVPAVHEQLGRALRKSGRFQDAIDIFENAAKQFPDHVGHFLWLKGRVEFRQGQFDAAIWSYRQALEAAHCDWRVYVDLGKACASARHAGDAINAFREAVRTAPESEKRQIKDLIARLRSGGAS
ncbi:MAG: tetratricopeptide repeat protein [bacterium]|nr:tetratricopeptide repeat protein [bacterium]